MNRKLAAIWMSLMISFSFIVVVIEIVPKVKAPAIIYVDDEPGGIPSENYTVIQWAIDNASEGDTIYVYNGTYYEHIVIDKTINIIGENKDNTIIDGGGSENVVNIWKDWVNISGFTIKGSGPWPGNYKGMELYNVKNCKVFNNIISNNNHGIYLQSSSSNIIASNNLTLNNGYSINIESSSNSNIIANNNLFSNDGRAIYIKSSSKNNITNNILFENDGWGILLWSSSYNNISDNDISYNTWGITLKSSSNNNNILNNSIFLSTHAHINLDSSSNNSILNNNLSSHAYGIRLESSSNDTIESNNFIRCGIVIEGTGLHHFNSHTISDNNSVNGKPLYYYKDSSSFNIDGIPVGQVILANCSNVNVNNLQINQTNVGVELAYCINISVTNNRIISSNHYGFLFISSLNNTIVENTVKYHDYGIFLLNSNKSIFHHNNIRNNGYQVILINSPNNIWDDNISEGNFWSDYSGLDDGSNGRIAGDGVGDTEVPHPYTDKGNGYYQLDNYPLIYPIGNYIFLYEGWNLISIPFIQSDTNLSSVLNSITGSYKAVQWYNATDSNDHWKHNSISKPSELNDLNSINHKMGFWIYITKPGGVLFQYFGIQPTENQSITLYPGWNLVGYPSLTSYNRTDGLNNLTFDNQVDAIWSYDAATQKWEEMGETDYFEIGKGYYIHAKSECEWEVPL